MTHEQKPESAEFRTHAMEELCAAQDFHDRVVSSSLDDQIAVGQDHHTRLERAVRAVIAEARSAADQEEQGIEEAKDEGANYVLTSLALLFGRDGFEIRDGSETWEGDVNATLEGILKAGGLIDEEGDLLDLATLKDRSAEQRRKDAEGAEPVGYVRPDMMELFRQSKALFTSASIIPKRDETHTEALYTYPANVAALIAEAVAAERERCAKVCDALAQNISHERGSLPDWETGEVTLDELSEVEFEAFERAAEALREGGEHG